MLATKIVSEDGISYNLTPLGYVVLIAVVIVVLAALDIGATPGYTLIHIIIPQIASGIISGFVMAVTLSLDDYFVATYTKPATFDTISTYVVNATKGSQTNIRTALWALSTIIFLIVVIVEVVMNFAPIKNEAQKEKH